jgi:chemotaxis protein MotB
MSVVSRRSRYALDIWPGFVDALASLLMVFVFMLLIFVLAQFFLTDTLTGRNQALAQLSEGINELFEVLSLERQKSTSLEQAIADLSSRLQSTVAERDSLAQALETATARARAAAVRATELQAELESAFATISSDQQQIEHQLQEITGLQSDIAALRHLRGKLEAQVGDLKGRLREREDKLTAARRRLDQRDTRIAELSERVEALDRTRSEQAAINTRSQARIRLLNDQLSALRTEIARLASALTASEATVKTQKIKLAELGQRLNTALADKVEELGRYRSEFFGRLRQVLGERSDIRIVGDRFLLQSELLFDTASADIGPEGKQQLAQLAKTLHDIAQEIPSDIDWILRIDGHTDRRPIHTDKFPSNWELSMARALSIVDYLIEQGIPAERLAATGFGQHHPLDPANTESAYRQNRRIELKLTQP